MKKIDVTTEKIACTSIFFRPGSGSLNHMEARMSQVEAALQSIRAAAQKVGGVSVLAARAGVGVHAARAMVREKPQQQIQDLKKLEAEALKVQAE